MAYYKIVVVNENHLPTARVDVEAIATSDRSISAVVETDRAGMAEFTGLTGPHFFRPRVRRTSGTVGGRVYTGQVKVQVVAFSGAICYDLVVDSNGMGTHTTLFGADGALVEAADDQASRNILVMGEHSESIGAATALPALATSQRITITSCGPYRPTISTDNGITAAWITHGTASSGSGSVLRFEGIQFDRPTAAGGGAFFAGSGGYQVPNLEFADISWGGSKWTELLDFRTGAASVKDITFERNRSFAAITSILDTDTATSHAGKFTMKDCDWSSLGTVAARTNSTDVDPVTGIDIEGNIFRLITSFIWQRTFNYPFTFKDNMVLDFNQAARCIDIGTAGTTNPQDVVIADNYIRSSNNNANTIAVRV